ncbi:hypothetical protein JN531_000110 [Flagellatimonas centrodinii]|uniref:transcription termination/antitermination NusG family protein n=1 Tax=Flagellatimonas centrodinii TaxID=2806210 RepID=UPI001FEDAB0C|nr:transcription termination/antitermination NusG family protein [Flagellatimonas centrodinii]ULQ46712.1 hypothetical protein JN531_000110 [Flagellatimonas centrodinii]
MIDIAEGQHWHLLTSRPRMEGRVIAHLDRLNLPRLAPTIPCERWVNGKRTLRDEWLFPRYVFVQVDFDHTPYNHLQYLPGVSGFVRSAGRLLQVPPAVVHNLRQRTEATGETPHTPVARFSHGQRLRLNGGGFVDVEAIYLEPDGQHRSVMLIQMLGREVETRVDNLYLAAN